eukprot:857023-Prorocentrum_minimum.AAC.1
MDTVASEAYCNRKAGRLPSRPQIGGSVRIKYRFQCCSEAGQRQGNAPLGVSVLVSIPKFSEPGIQKDFVAQWQRVRLQIGRLG